MSPIKKRNTQVYKAGGYPVHKAARIKRVAKATEEWKPIRWRCRLCKRPKKWPGQICPCVEHKRWRDETFEWQAGGAGGAASGAASGAAGGAADSAAKAAEKASQVINLVSDDEMEAGMSPKGGAPNEAQARDIFSGQTWVCPRCTFAGNRLCVSTEGRQISLPCEVCRYGD